MYSFIMVVLCFFMCIFLKYFPVIGHLDYSYYYFSYIPSTTTINFQVHTTLLFNIFKLKIIKEKHT